MYAVVIIERVFDAHTEGGFKPTKADFQAIFLNRSDAEFFADHHNYPQEHKDLERYKLIVVDLVGAGTLNGLKELSESMALLYREPVVEKISVLSAISELELPIRAENILQANHIHYVGDLIKHSPKSLLQIRGLGRTMLRDIVGRLNCHDLMLYNQERFRHLFSGRGW